MRSIRRHASSALLATCCIAFPLYGQSRSDIDRWERQAQNVTIVRDDWGIAHVYGKTDADAVFGMEYAQAEDDFNRIETNYLNSLGRLAEAEGEGAVFQDLRQRLFVDPDSLRAQYARSPAWLKRLMDAFADGLNFFLYKHPEVKPRVITRFEPWMALSFTEGSIGGDIERITLRDLAALYGDSGNATPGPRTGDGEFELDPSGSNGIAIAPRLTVNNRALLWINPHTSFYFRSELQMVSEEGLNAYGAVTWGQFFIYQGFNEKAGWIHTSSGVDNIDEFLESQPERSRKITVPFKTATGLAQRTFTVHYTRRGPIVRKEGERLVSVSLMWQPINALIQSYSRTKARDYAAFRKVMDLHTNSSNNTVFADASGNIAHFHSNYIPRRDTSFDWTRPVDAGNPATAYKGVLSFDETPNVVNPASGWVYNANNWPWSAAGEGVSPSRDKYPRYVETGAEETARGYHALRVLGGKSNWTMNALRDAAFDSYLPAFERMVPPLLAAYDQAPSEKLAEPIAVLRGWDYRWGAESVPTSLAVYWGGSIGRRVARDARAAGISVMQYVATNRARPNDLLGALADAVDTLTANLGTWKTPWGAINRFQRISAEIAPRFDDTQPSIPVPFTASVWGSLAAFGSRPYPNTKKWYGTSGNSFVAVVEFGDSVRAKAVTAGGESGSPRSPHFNDQAERYASGNLRDVYFYRSQLVGHTEREYRPGERLPPR
ncbi:MAG TPA: penicillin acylase family protein [Gemmatimonadales bacterium]|nr:penicillin acylase family protein [Gemmatimonadales bacterium]